MSLRAPSELIYSRSDWEVPSQSLSVFVSQLNIPAGTLFAFGPKVKNQCSIASGGEVRIHRRQFSIFEGTDNPLEIIGKTVTGHGDPGVPLSTPFSVYSSIPRVYVKLCIINTVGRLLLFIPYTQSLPTANKSGISDRSVLSRMLTRKRIIIRSCGSCVRNCRRYTL